MKTANLFRHWWALLIQGIVMITLSLVIFSNPQVILAALALWLGIGILITGLVGTIGFFISPKSDRDIATLVGSLVIFILGLAMLLEKFVAMRAITLVFGIQVSVIGLLLALGSWNGRKEWPIWWLVAMMGMATFLLGINSVVDIYSGAKNISFFIGVPILISGVGLVSLAFLKMKLEKIR